MHCLASGLGEVNKQLDEFEASLQNNVMLLRMARC